MSARSMRLFPVTRARRIVVVLLVLVVAFAGFTLRLFVFPAVDTPAHSDAIVVLGGSGDAPIQTGVTLADKGFAPLLVLSLRPNEQCLPTLLRLTVPVHVVCFHADPQTTQGEARSIAHLAKVDHLHRIIVVAPTSQVTRARLRVRRCYSGQILMDGVATGSFWSWAYAIPYEWGATVKALTLQRGC
jgi:hypothetical protein